MNCIDWALWRKGIFHCPHSPMCGSDNVISLTLQPLPPKLSLSKHRNKVDLDIEMCLYTTYLYYSRGMGISCSQFRLISHQLLPCSPFYSFLLQCSDSFLFKIFFLSSSLKTIHTMSSRPSIFLLPWPLYQECFKFKEPKSLPLGYFLGGVE